MGGMTRLSTLPEVCIYGKSNSKDYLKKYLDSEDQLQYFQLLGVGAHQCEVPAI